MADILEGAEKIYIQTGCLYKISKQKARKLFEEGEAYPYKREDIYICASNMIPDNMWQPAIQIFDRDYQGESFDDLVNSFEYYNCDSERGKYSVFYLPKKF